MLTRSFAQNRRASCRFVCMSQRNVEVIMIVLRWIGWALLRLVLAARYRLRVHGREKLTALTGPVLVLPNHPGYIDPFLLFAALWPSLRMRPLVYSGTFVGPTGRLMVWMVNALEVPNLEVASVQARTEA